MNLQTKQSFKILFVEDVAEDAEIAVRKLRRDGLDCTYQRVDTETEFRKALATQKPDIVIADYSMPIFDGLTAFKICHEHDPYIPFIILTGSINEDTAVACMKAGANDYVLKDNINRLSLAVQEAIERKKLEKKARLQELQLRQSEERYRSIFTNSTAIMMIIDPNQDGQIVDANKAAEDFYGWGKEELLRKKIIEINCLSPEEVKTRMEEAKQKQVNYFNFRHKTASGLEKDVEVHSGPVQFSGKIYLFSVIHDISRRKKAEQERDILFKELHHRVKNNMQIISSLLNLSIYEINDEKIAKKLKDISRRIESMAIVHEQFYESPHLSVIQFNMYLQNLYQYILSETELEVQPELVFDFTPITVDLDFAIPAGLLISELFSELLDTITTENTTKVTIHLTLKKNLCDNNNQECIIVEFMPSWYVHSLPCLTNSQDINAVLFYNLLEQVHGHVAQNRESGERIILQFESPPKESRRLESLLNNQ
ncbi:histidine kinase dimerization/phosphoacceptor domain -containing protein [Gracilinema caldarium]|uniref:histidine kinase dimerization/phosphoacceptor domain -containing protein n=1 Tax=Gracilinema caldarium TaxID=215591 RepID=UPI0026EF8ED7|nr:histidine kinase dimerization/phosphoacceptor domain -containing protein [Gracilinema caldarium]